MRWRAPVSFDAASTARLVSESLRHLGYAHVREAATRTTSETVIALTVPRETPAHRFRVSAPADFVVDAYDTRPAPGALMPYLEAYGYLPEHEPHVRALLAEVARRAPRPPWRFSWGQRLAAGLLRREWRESREAWRQVVGADAAR